MDNKNQVDCRFQGYGGTCHSPIVNACNMTSCIFSSDEAAKAICKGYESCRTYKVICTKHIDWDQVYTSKEEAMHACDEIIYSFSVIPSK